MPKYSIFLNWQVFGASNVELVTKTRTEHLSEQDKEKTKKTAKNPLESFLGIAEQHEKVQGAEANGVSYSVCIYFNGLVNCGCWVQIQFSL